MGIRDIFRKFKNEDTVIDLSDMPKKRVFNKSQGGTVDLTSGSSRIARSGESSLFAFLGNLAGTSGNSSNPIPEPGETAEVSSTYVSYNQKQKLRGMLRDLKAKIDAVYDKIYKITDRIDLIEKKIERLERRTGVSDI